MGIPILVTVLTEDRDDLDLVRGALECLVHAMTPTSLGNQPGAAGGLLDTAATGDQLPAHPPPTTAKRGTPDSASAQEAQAGAVNAELFARRPEHVQLLLQVGWLPGQRSRRW